MKAGQRENSRVPTLAPCVLGLIIITLVLPTFITINTSSSIPRGIYVRKFGEVQHGDIVRFSYAGEHIDFLKEVVALSGDDVCICESEYRVNGRLLGYRHAGISEYTYCGAVGESQIFVFGSHTNSNDSRYYGPIERNEILASYWYMTSY